jgi:hypothetical protein
MGVSERGSGIMQRVAANKPSKSRLRTKKIGKEGLLGKWDYLPETTTGSQLVSGFRVLILNRIFKNNISSSGRSREKVLTGCTGCTGYVGYKDTWDPLRGLKDIVGK